MLYRISVAWSVAVALAVATDRRKSVCGDCWYSAGYSHFLSIWINAAGKLTERNQEARLRGEDALRKRDILNKHRVRCSFVNIMDQCMKSDCVYFV